MNEVKAALDKIFSKETLAYATDLIIRADHALPGDDKAEGRHTLVVEGLVDFVEKMDDKVSLIPNVGFILKAIIDSAPVDGYERRACAAVVELAYQTLRLEPNQSGR